MSQGIDPIMSVSKNGVLALDGYGLRVAVLRRHLVAEDGMGFHRRRGRFSKATSKPPLA